MLLIGWDFDTRIELDRPDNGSDVPNTLGKLLKWVVGQRPELQIHVLRWNLGALNALGRGATPLVILDWMTDERIHFKLELSPPGRRRAPSEDHRNRRRAGVLWRNRHDRRPLGHARSP